MILQPKAVIDCNRNLLLGPKITFRRLNRRMPQQKFDLLEIATALAAELDTGSAQVRRSSTYT